MEKPKKDILKKEQNSNSIWFGFIGCHCFFHIFALLFLFLQVNSGGTGDIEEGYDIMALFLILAIIINIALSLVSLKTGILKHRRFNYIISCLYFTSVILFILMFVTLNSLYGIVFELPFGKTYRENAINIMEIFLSTDIFIFLLFLEIGRLYLKKNQQISTDIL